MERPPLRVLHLIDSLARGGAENLLVQCVLGLSEQKNWIYRLYSPNAFEEELQTYPSECLELNRYSQIFSRARILKNFIKENSIDLIHSHLFRATVVGRLAASMAGIPLVTTYHSALHEKDLPDYHWKTLWLDRLTYRSRFYTIFVSQKVALQTCTSLSIHKNFSVLPNFAADSFVPTYRWKENSELKLVAVGNLRHQKNYPLAIEALSALKNLPISLDIFGNGSLKEELENKAKAVGAKVRIFTGQLIQSELLANYDAFLMTSYLEGMPISLLESMRTGLPSILNDLDELKETAEDSAFYFDRNSGTSLAELLLKIYKDKNLLKYKSERAQILSHRFKKGNYLKELQKIYEKVTTSDGRLNFFSDKPNHPNSESWA